MITALAVENWKSYEKAALNVDALTILIGTNSSGKSNLLDALAFLNRISLGAMLTVALQGDGALSPLRGGVEWSARKPKDHFALSVTFRVSEVEDLEYRIDCSVSQSRCDLRSEQLRRARYRPDQSGKRGAKNGNGIILFGTDEVIADSPTIVARLYNEKGGSRRQLGRSTSVLFQLLG